MSKIALMMVILAVAVEASSGFMVSSGFKIAKKLNYSAAMIREADSRAQVYTQLLDHFDAGNKATWSQVTFVTLPAKIG